MPKTPKDKASPATMTFETAMERLEEVVDSMQSPDLPLDQIIERYEEGMTLMAFCSEKQAAAEQKIELLTRQKSGKFSRSPSGDAAPEGKAESEAERPRDGEDDEARLF
jgi:exodeoxyribonuclease VII small subunit